MRRERPAVWRALNLATLLVCAVSAERAAAAEPPAAASAEPPAAASAEPPAEASAAASAPAPDDDSATEVTVGRFVIDAEYPEMAADASRIFAPLMGHAVAVARIRAAGAELERAYVDRGHFLTYVTIPSQEIPDGGECHLRVIHGFIESVDVDAVPVELRSRVLPFVRGLVGDAAITRTEFERAVLLAGDLPALTLASELRRGNGEGGVVLALSGTYRRLANQASVDNAMPPSDGRTSVSLSSAYADARRHLDLVTLTANAAADTDPLRSDSRRRQVDGGLRSLIGSSGAQLELHYSWSHSNPATAGGNAQNSTGNPLYDTDSTYTKASLRVSYPVIKAQTTTVTVAASFEAASLRQDRDPAAASLYDDRLRVLRLASSAEHRIDARTLVTFGAEWSQGLHGLGSRGAGQASVAQPLSQPGATDRFSKFEANASVHRALAATVAADLQLRAQYVGARPLLATERFMPGGPADLSAYDVGTFSGDRGWVSRFELQRTWNAAEPKAAPVEQGYLFAARGDIASLAAGTQPPHTEIGNAAGMGLRFSKALVGARAGPLDLSAEAARQFNPASSGLHDAWRLNFAASLRF
jgi:hemolysin activation/secretion protein